MPASAPVPVPAPRLDRSSPRAAARGRRDGRWLVAASAVVAAALAAIALASAGAGEAGLRLGLRLSARQSCALFVLVFAATPLARAAPSRPGKWLLRNRTHLGVALAASQGAHLALIVALAAASPASFASRLAASTAIGGGVGFALLALMTATSFERPARAVGRRAWRVLHRAGLWTLWLIFTSTYAGLAPRAPAALVAVVPLVGLAALRAWLAVARRRPR